MGAAPSREAEESYLQELTGRRSKTWQVERRRKEISLLPLTKPFMHLVQPSPPSSPHNSPDAATSTGRRARGGDGSSSATPSSARKNFFPAYRDDDAPPASLPFMQQLYSAYREPSTQFFCRKEMWGTMNRLPQELYYPTIETFYDATVGCYEEEVYESNDAMQQVVEDYLMKERLQNMNEIGGGGVPMEKSAEPKRRPRKALKAPKVRPIPCAICFEYPTCSVAPPPKAGSEATTPAASLNRSGAPYGSVVLAPYCSVMVIGFVGLVPVRHSRKATSAAFLRPPSTSAGDEGEGSAGAVVDGGAEYELVAFIAKSAGEQHLGRALFQAAFLYTEQCRRAGLCAIPLPSTRFSCFFTDVPSLCFLREVRLRCADAGWPKRLARTLRRVRLAGRHLSLEMDRVLAGDLCVFMAECYERLDFHPPPTSASCLFFGFVGDVGSQVLPSSALSPSIAPAPLPCSGNDAVRAVLMEKAEREALLSRGGVLASSAGPRKRRGSDGANSEAAEADGDADATVQLYCVVGTNRLTQGTKIYPHGTVLEQTVQVATGHFLKEEWAVAVDGTGQERPPTDFYETTPEDAAEYTISVVPAASGEPRQTFATSDVLLSWSKDLYLQARVAEAKDTHWVAGYPQDYYTAGKNGYKRAPTAAQMEALKPPAPHLSSSRAPLLTSEAIQAVATIPSTPAEASTCGEAANVFYLWEFEHQEHRYTVGLVPNFVRAQQRALANKRNSRNKSDAAHPRKPTTTATAATAAAVECVDPTSEADVSAAASLSGHSLHSHSGRSSNHSSNHSGHSGDTYRTAGSSHSTLSNFAMTQSRRNSRQRQYFLSLGTDTVYRNGKVVSGDLSRVGSESRSQVVAHGSGDGPVQYGRGDFNGTGQGMDGSLCGDGARTISFSSSDLPKPGVLRDSQRALLSPHRQQQLLNSSRLTPHSSSHVPCSTQPLQRRLSGGVSHGVQQLQLQQQHQRRQHEIAGALPDSLYDSLKEEMDCDASTRIAGPHTVPVFPMSTFPMPSVPPEARASTQAGPRRGMHGPSQTLAHGTKGNTFSSVLSTQNVKFKTPVMRTAGNVQHALRGVDGEAEYRWDWRGAASKKD